MRKTLKKLNRGYSEIKPSAMIKGCQSFVGMVNFVSIF